MCAVDYVGAWNKLHKYRPVYRDVNYVFMKIYNCLVQTSYHFTNLNSHKVSIFVNNKFVKKMTDIEFEITQEVIFTIALCSY